MDDNLNDTPKLSDKDLLTFTFLLSALAYADHYYDRSLLLLVEKLRESHLIDDEIGNRIICILAKGNIYRTSELIQLDISTDVIEIKPFYKEQGWVWQPSKPAGFMLRINKDLIIAFRGTSKFNFMSTITNFDMWKDSNSSQSIVAHRGFLRKVASSKKDVQEILKSHKDCLVTFTGHSNGGSQAIIMALDCTLEKSSHIRKVITWAGASGLYGDSVKIYNDHLAAKTLQVINQLDTLAILSDKIGIQRVSGALWIRPDSNGPLVKDPHDRFNSYFLILTGLLEMEDAHFGSILSELSTLNSFTLDM